MKDKKNHNDVNRSRSERVFIRLTKEEKEAFEKRCAESGQSQADYFRQVCLSSKPLRKRKSPHPNAALLLKYLGHLGKIGSNINQIARETNGGHLPYSQKVDAMRKDISHIRSIIREALGYDH